MGLNKRKKSKKDLLKGAMEDGMPNENTISDFINDIHNDKKARNEPDETPPQETGIKKIQKPQPPRDTDNQGSLPMIRPSNIKEWWISLGAFLTVLLLIVFFIILPLAPKNQYQLLLSTNAIDNVSFEKEAKADSFELGKPVYVYFIAKNPFKMKKIYIDIYNLTYSSSDKKLSSLETNINPKWKKLETHFQQEFFETTGSYKIVIEDEKKKPLVEKTFLIK